MRAPAPLIALLIGLAAAPLIGASARAAGSEAPVIKQEPPRGPQSAGPTAARPVAANRLPVAFAALASPVPPDAGECRLACAQTYYFCLAGAAPDACPGGWTRCLAGCSRDATEP